MANKTIDHLDFMVDVTPYEHEGNKYDALYVGVSYSKGYGFYVSWQPVERTQYGYKTGPLPSSDKLVGGVRFLAEQAQKNSAKRLTEMMAALELAKEGIALYFDKRLFEQLNNFMRYVAIYGFTEHYRQDVERLKGATEVAPVMRQYNDLKKKHPDSLLLFRTDDTYEAYEGDALACSKILCTKLVKSRAAGDAYDKVSFMSSELDIYLPRLIRAGKRVALCDQINENNNNQNSEDETMKTNETIENKNVQDAQVNNNVTTEADVAEVEDIVPVVKPKEQTHPQPLPVSEGSGQTSGRYRVVLVPAKDGGEWPKLYGFLTGEEAEKMVGKMAKSIRNSWDRDEKNEKRFYIKGGKKYCEVFQRLCDALNAGDKAAIDQACKDSVAVYEGAVESGKAEREAKKNASKPQASAASPEPQKEYSKEDVAAMLRKVLAGGEVPADIEKLIAA